MSYSSAHIVAAPNEFQLNFPVHVPISKVQFSREFESRYFIASGWDGTIRIYALNGLNQAEERRLYFHGKSVLACTFAGYERVASGGLDQMVKLYDIESGTEINLGGHSLGIRCMEFSNRHELIVSGSWDSTIKLWDIRHRQGTIEAKVSDRVYAMDVNNDKILVGTKDRKIFLYDIRRMDNPEQVRESPLKYQTRNVAFFPSPDAFVVSSIEGRVAVEYVNQSPDEQKKKYAFKCHRNKESDGTETIYPVNALAFHPKHSTFATGGSDAIVNIWDPYNRKRLVQLHKFNTSIQSLSFNNEGNLLAIAASYGHELEDDPNPLPDNVITIRSISEGECKPK
ncbi:hypothetical protein WR25_21748 [Diploscapter pachys]|uniref:Uncharacterized protein n=1 Tax=Diploscapter pachys TaxID=2018661 RepID=A0A2A2JHG1_9BILA|nr:hypothetical protein WR25_21748 [Diploscapter pachys]